ncbi:MAG TPA: response regulator, partial [Rhodopila sp.]|nr:response regulator [Rhodopila sp.]
PVLVLDENAADALAVDRLLSGSPYQPFHARSLGAVRTALSRLHPAVIILDAPDPMDDRWRLVSALREDDRQAKIPVIATSQAGGEGALHPAAAAVLPKPLAAAQLLDALHRLTGGRLATKVLLVDDEEVARYLVGQLLPRSHYSLRTATSGAQGLDLLAEERPDVILLDLNMPGMSGFEVLERLRQDTALSSIPVIIITSALLDSTEQYRLRDAAAVIVKAHLSAVALDTAIQSALGAPVAAVAE